MEFCSKCGKPLTADDIGMTRKLINRGADTFQCLDCLSELFGVDREFLCKKIAYFRKMGCTLFTEEPGDREIP